MPFINRLRRWGARACALVLTACASGGTNHQAPADAVHPRPAPNPAPNPSPNPSPNTAGRPSDDWPVLGVPQASRSWSEFKLQAGQRLVAANPQMTYTGDVPDILLAIPVLEVELNADGSIRRVEVMRRPTQAQDTVQLAIEAVRRAAPFGDVRRLPKPWKYTETFLFNDERRFKPRSLD